jgi:CubicO group peptidase (beta-lactamase class C family)
MEQFRLKDTNYYYEPEISMHPAYLFRMSALDLARFGLLYLREGRWRGQQILSADWIHRSIKNYSVLNPKQPERGYGFLWWLGEGMYYAAGTGGQRLFIIPKDKVVIVHRVNTDSKVRVNSKSIWKLYDKIIKARGK